MTSDVVTEKLEALRRCLSRIESRTPPSAEALAADLDAQDILSLNLERATQKVVDLALHILSTRDAALPNNMVDAVRGLVPLGAISAQTAERMAKAIGFRNLSVHAYRAIDWAIVYAIATKHLADFRQFMREIVAAR
jgi:uncharacterized protein YutE (UPF0331/DUF86 family)